MSAFWKNIFPFFSKKEKKKENSNVIRDVDPNEIWEIVGELGDGTFGKVYKVSRRVSFLSVDKWLQFQEECCYGLQFRLQSTSALQKLRSHTTITSHNHNVFCSYSDILLSNSFIFRVHQV